MIRLFITKVIQTKSLSFAMIVFFLVFHASVPTIAQNRSSTPDNTEIGQNILKFIITKDTKDSQLETIKSKLAEEKATVVFENVDRNDRKEITGIKIDYDHNGKKGNFFINSENPIKDIAISLNVNENELSVGQTSKNLSQSFEIKTEDGDKKVKTSKSGSNVVVYTTNDDDEKETTETIIVVGKNGEDHVVKKEKKIYIIKSDSERISDGTEDGVFVKKSKKDTVWIKKDVKNIVWTDDEGNDVEIIAVERGSDKIRIFTDGGEQPLIFLDGKEISKKELEKVQPDDIQSVNVLKGEEAIKKHGKRAKQGVIEIISNDN